MYIGERTPTLMRNFRKEFNRKLAEVGEELVGEVPTQRIMDIIEQQGYYSTVRYNIYYTTGAGFRIELRMFGGRP